MKVHYWQSDEGNFGDDLNRFLWRDLEPSVFSHADEDITFFGVGTVLFEGTPKTRVRVVLGSGVGYGRLPSDLLDSGWHFYAVRGPLTARAVDREPSLAVADPAILLPTLPGYKSTERKGTIFVPHWITVKRDCWREPCRLAGIDYIDPRADPKEVIRRLSSAEHVITESMHGAIIADAFRVPWSAVVCEHYAPLKWHDWALSLGIDYEPYRLGGLSSSSRVLAQMLQRRGRKLETYRSVAEDDLRAFLLRTSSVKANEQRRNTKQKVRAALDAAVDVFMPTGRIAEYGAELLHAVKTREPRLSADSIIERKQDMLLERLERLARDYRAGRFAGKALASES